MHLDAAAYHEPGDVLFMRFGESMTNTPCRRSHATPPSTYRLKNPPGRLYFNRSGNSHALCGNAPPMEEIADR